jgi:16S rRNA (uracil1498-N3)-methyltransferase
MAERFYTNQDLRPGPVVLTGPEAHHLATVCRVGPGEMVALFNGDGREYRAEVRQTSKREVTLEVVGVEAPDRERRHRLILAASLPKGDRATFLVEKLTELGVSDFVPLHTARSVVHPRESKREKLQRQVIEASKQCRRNVLLQVHPLTPWVDYCRASTLPENRFLAHPGTLPLAEYLRDREGVPLRGDVVAAVGPEGGFTEEEVEQGRTMGWLCVDLGPRILRIETAALVLAVLLNS